MEDLDMIYNINGGQIMAGGYAVNSILLNDQQPAIYQQNQEGGKDNKKVSDRFKNLAVPAGLLYINDPYKNNTDAIINDSDAIINDSDAIINDALYEKLLHLAGPDKKYNDINSNMGEKIKKQTRSKKGKGKKNKNKLTKKHLHRK